MVEIAVIGDVHCQFNAQDVHFFNQSNYDLLLFVGDLARYRHREGMQMAMHIARLQKPVFLLPGNHDAIHAGHLLAEIKGSAFWSGLFTPGQARRMRQLRQILGDALPAGYSTHPFDLHGIQFDLIAARPFAMGGSRLNYAAYLQQAYGVKNMAQSTAMLKQCVDYAQSDRLVFLAHNGPAGLGSARDDIWGCDFREGAGDFGDEDLQQAIWYAKQQGKQVVAVVAGHMHHALKGGGRRQWRVAADGTEYVNVARVPRIFEENGRILHHHVRLSLTETAVSIQEMYIPNSA